MQAQRKVIAQRVLAFTKDYDLNNPAYDRAVEELLAFDRKHDYWPSKLVEGDLICLEFGRLLGDADLVDAICEAFQMSPQQWAALTHAERVGFQIGFIAPMPFHQGVASCKT